MAQRTSLADSDGQRSTVLRVHVVLRASAACGTACPLPLYPHAAPRPDSAKGGVGLLAVVSGASSVAHVAHNQRAARALAQRSPAAETTASQSPTDLLNTLATHLAPSTYAFPPL
jgi:hypothetical protein